MTNVYIDSTAQGLVLGDKALVAEVFAKHGFVVLSNATGEEKASEVNSAERKRRSTDADTQR